MSKTILISPNCKCLYSGINVDSLGYKIIPFGLAYLGSIIKKYGHGVKIIDLNTQDFSESEFKNLLKKERPEFIGISCTTPTANSVIKLAEMSKNTLKHVGIFIGGYHPTALPLEMIKSEYIDFIVVGEGEKVIVDIVQGRPLNKIKGIVYKKKGKIIKNKSKSIVSNLDTLPYPIYSEFYKSRGDIKNYGTPTSRNTTGLIESRGCPYNCIFCANKLMNKEQIRARSPKNVVSEIEMLYHEYGISSFSFYDSALMLNKKRLHNICQEIITRKLKIKWECSSRVDLIDEETLKIMQKAGCISINFGIESGDPKILEIIKKGITIGQIEKTINLTKEIGMTCIGLFMIGHPFETKDSIKNTFKLAKRLPLDYAEFNLVIPLPGTELWHMAKNKQGLEILTKNWDEYTAYGKPAIKTLDLTREQLEGYQKEAYKQFYLRPSYMLKRLLNKNIFHDFKKSIVLLKFLMQK